MHFLARAGVRGGGRGEETVRPEAGDPRLDLRPAEERIQLLDDPRSLLLQAEGKRLRGPDIPIYSVDTQTRRLLAVLTGTANVRLKDDPRDDEDNANPQLFCKNTVDWRDRKDRLVMFGRLIESLSPLVFAKDRTPLTDPIG